MKSIATGLMATLLAVTATNAQAAMPATDREPMPLQQGSYLTLEGGFNAVQPVTFFNSFTGRNQRLKLKQGWALSASGGYKWSNGLRTELEFTYHRNSLRNLDSTNNPITGAQVTAAVMGNVLYDINTGTRFTPFIGGGIGGTMAWLKNVTQVATGITGIRNNESIKFTYQAIVGASVAVGPGWEFVTDVRYRSSTGHAFNLAPPDSFTKYNIREVTAMMGFRYAF